VLEPGCGRALATLDLSVCRNTESCLDYKMAASADSISISDGREKPDHTVCNLAEIV
jgi:hypothetical protein